MAVDTTFNGGYIVVTSQPDGSWRDDWDGEVHVESHVAVAAYRDAIKAVGHRHAVLCKVTPIHEED